MIYIVFLAILLSLFTVVYTYWSVVQLKKQILLLEKNLKK